MSKFTLIIPFLIVIILISFGCAATNNTTEVSELVIEALDSGYHPAETVTILVTYNGYPLADAMVTVNGSLEVGLTGLDGRIAVALNDALDEVKIEAVKGELDGKLIIDASD